MTGAWSMVRFRRANISTTDKCALPRFREEDIANRLGEPLKGLQVPPAVVSQIVTALQGDQANAAQRKSTERSKLESRLTSIRNRMDAAYTDKLDGTIPADFWERMMADWRMEEQQVKMAIQGLASAETGDSVLDAQWILELTNQAYSLYVSQNSVEKTKLLRMVFSNCSVQHPYGENPRYDLQKGSIGRMVGWTGRAKVGCVLRI